MRKLNLNQETLNHLTERGPMRMCSDIAPSVDQPPTCCLKCTAICGGPCSVNLPPNEGEGIPLNQ